MWSSVAWRVARSSPLTWKKRPEVLVDALFAANECRDEDALVYSTQPLERRVAAVVVDGDSSFDPIDLQNARGEIEQQSSGFVEDTAAPQAAFEKDSQLRAEKPGLHPT